MTAVYDCVEWENRKIWLSHYPPNDSTDDGVRSLPTSRFEHSAPEKICYSTIYKDGIEVPKPRGRSLDRLGTRDFPLTCPGKSSKIWRGIWLSAVIFWMTWHDWLQSYFWMMWHDWMHSYLWMTWNVTTVSHILSWCGSTHGNARGSAMWNVTCDFCDYR